MYSVVLLAALTAAPAQPNCCHRSCHGCYGCSGCYGCYGCSGCSGCYGCNGCYGGCWGGYSCSGSYGCFGGYDCAGYGCAGYFGGEAVPFGKGGQTPEGKGGQTPEGKGGQAPGAQSPKGTKSSDDDDDKETRKIQSRLIVDLPEDAKLFVDGQLMKTQSGKRTFRTPALEKGQAYFYVLRAEVVREGKVQTQTRRVIVRGGEEITASFRNLDGVATAKK